MYKGWCEGNLGRRIRVPQGFTINPDWGKQGDNFYELIWIKTPIQFYDSLPKDYYLVPNNETIKLECGFP